MRTGPRRMRPNGCGYGEVVSVSRGTTSGGGALPFSSGDITSQVHPAAALSQDLTEYCYRLPQKLVSAAVGHPGQRHHLTSVGGRTDRGPLFLYAELRDQGRAAEAWLPVTQAALAGWSSGASSICRPVGPKVPGHPPARWSPERSRMPWER